MPRSDAQSVGLVLTCAFVMTINVICATGVSIALPRIGKDLGIPVERLQWIISAFSLAAGSFFILFGRLADLYGRRRVFLSGLAWMTAFSIGCGFSQHEVTINLLRALQGVGIAATIPAAVGILAHSFDPSSRARSVAFATFSAGAPTGGAIGNILGGVLTQETKPSWRSVFFVVAGFCVLSFIGGALFIDPDPPSEETDRRVDWIGAALVTVGIALVTFALGQAPVASKGWRTPYIGPLLAVGVLLILSFIYWEHHLTHKTTRPPLMRLELWTRANGRFAAIMVMAFLDWGAFIAFYTWATLYYQDYEQLSPIATMLRFIPMAVTGLILNLIVALVVGILPIVVLLAAGCAMTGVAGLLFALINPNAVYWAFGLPATILSVFGADFMFAGGSIFVARVAHRHEQSLAGALFQTLTQFGAALGLAITTLVFNGVVEKRSKVPGADALLDGYRAAQWTNFGFAMLATVFALLFFRGVGVIGGHAKDNEYNVDPESSSATPKRSTEKDAVEDLKQEEKGQTGEDEPRTKH